MDFLDTANVSWHLRIRAIPHHDHPPARTIRSRAADRSSNIKPALRIRIATDQSRKIVFVVKDDDTVEARAVELGPLDEDLRVVRTGLKPNDHVIMDGIQRARVGAKVAPKKAEIGGKKS